MTWSGAIDGVPRGGGRPRKWPNAEPLAGRLWTPVVVGLIKLEPT